MMEQRLERDALPQLGELEQGDLEDHLLAQRVAEAALEQTQLLEQGEGAARGEDGGELDEGLALARRQLGLDRLGRGLEEGEVAEEFQQVLGQLAQVLARGGQRPALAEDGGGIVGHDGEREVDHRPDAGQAEHLEHALLRDVVAEEADHLVERHLGVAQAAVGVAGDGAQGRLVGGRALLLADEAQVARDGRLADAAEVEALAAGEDGGRDLVDFRGREDELHVRGRLLEGLEQRVERRRAQHVDLVDDVDLEAALDRGEADIVAQVAHLLDPVVRGAVDLQHVERAALGDLAADLGLGVEVDLRPVGRVERLGDDAGGRGLAGAARADQEVGLGDAPHRDRVGQRPGDVLLADHLGERLGPILAGEDLVGHGGVEEGVGDRSKNEKPGATTTAVRGPLLPFGPGGVGLPTLCRSWDS